MLTSFFKFGSEMNMMLAASYCPSQSRSMLEVDVDDATMGAGLDQREISATQVLPLPAPADLNTEAPLASDAAPASSETRKRRRVEDFEPIMTDLKQKLKSAGSSLREESFKMILAIDAKEWGALFGSSVEVPCWGKISDAVRSILGLPAAWV